MPTPVGHSLFGLAVYMIKKGEPLDAKDIGGVAIYASLSNLPDIDLAPITIYGFKAVSMFHQQYTHNLGFAVISSLFVACIATCFFRKRFVSVFPLFFFLVYSHILLDCMGHDTNPPYGVQLFWPLSDDNFLSPISLFIGVAKASPGELFSLWNFVAVLIELVVFLPVIGVVHTINSRQHSNQEYEKHGV